MKLPIIMLASLLFAIMTYAWVQGPEVFSPALKNSGSQLLRFAPIMVIAVLLSGFAEAVIPKQFIETWLSDASGWRGIFIAWIAGIVTPVAGVFGMPLAASLYKAGAGLAVIMTFLTSLATLSLVKMPIEVGFYGWRLTMVRFGVSLILPLIAGGLTQMFLASSQIK